MATVNVSIPRQLTRYTDGEAEFVVVTDTIDSMLNAIKLRHSMLGEKVIGNDGQLKRFIRMYVNGVDVRSFEEADSLLTGSVEVTLLPAFSGG